MRTLSVVVLVCLLGACSCESTSEEQLIPTLEPEPGLVFPRDATAFEAELAALDEEISKAEARAVEQPNSWLVLEKVANAWLQRARLSGSYDDYAMAEDALERAFERAAEGSGPLLTRAALNFTLHRLDLVDPDLDVVADRIILDDITRAVIESMRGDLAFARGQYALAREHFDAALELDRTPSILSKLALWHWRMGDFDQAEATYLEGQALLIGPAFEPRAWTHLQLGIMDLERGRYEDAFAHYRDGAEQLGGWWLIEEHIAEIAVLLDMPKFALALYDDIIARTGKPEFIDAKASLLAASGDATGAAALVEQAAAIYETELERFPEASYGHALGHYLEFGPPARALELAEANHTLRPAVEAKLGLAEARLGVADVAGAKAIIDEALATDYVSADLFWIGSLVHAAHGDADKAAELREQAEALNPHVAD
jgi:tetratricopeptide (TPR) repeat protein